MKRYVMAVDLGTSFIKTGIYSLDGACVAASSRPVQAESASGGVFIQRGDAILQAATACMKDASHAAGNEVRARVAAIGFTGQMAGVIGVGADWEDLTGWSCSLDTRYTPYARMEMEDSRDALMRIGGTNCPLMSSKCRWFKAAFPERAARVRKYMMISSYILGRLGAGKVEDAVIDRSYITWTGLADVKTGAWSDELCERAGITAQFLPRIVSPDNICARLSPAAAESTGLPEGIPLVAGAGDKIAGCIGIGKIHPGNLVFEASTYGAVSCVAKGFSPNMTHRDYDLLPGMEQDSFVLHKYIPGSGITLKWQAALTEGGSDDSSKSLFARIEAAASRTEPGADGLMAVGLPAGTAMPFDDALKGSWFGYGWQHGKGHFYRALVESYSYEVKLTLDSVREQYPNAAFDDSITMIGGGARTDFWPQILADVTGMEVRVPDRDDAALVGCALIAAAGAGLMSREEACSGKSIPPGRFYRPNARNTALYGDLAKKYRALRRGMRSLYADLDGQQKGGL